MRTDATAPFLDTWVAVGQLDLRVFEYEKEIAGTPLEGHEFFRNHSRVRRAMIAPATYTDLLRVVILHNYGGAPSAFASSELHRCVFSWGVWTT